VLLAGLPVPDRLVRDLVRSLGALGRDGTAEALETARRHGRTIVRLTRADQEAILAALSGCPYGLSELRAVTLLEHQWRPSPPLADPVPASSL